MIFYQAVNRGLDDVAHFHTIFSCSLTKKVGIVERHRADAIESVFPVIRIEAHNVSEKSRNEFSIKS